MRETASGGVAVRRQRRRAARTSARTMKKLAAAENRARTKSVALADCSNKHMQQQRQKNTGATGTKVKNKVTSVAINASFGLSSLPIQ